MFWKNISLAPFLYSNVHKDHGGPIASISCRESERLGVTVFEAFATLDQSFTGISVKQSSLYGNSHGSGTAQSKAEAVYRAVSEALERWAWFGSFSDPKLKKLTRVDLDSSTSGFAAFPGLFSRAARPNAFLEAAERWSLNVWWENKLKHRLVEANEGSQRISGLEILSPIPDASIAIVWKKSEQGQTYGFAASIDLASAIAKAKVELGRNIHVLKYAKESGIAPSTQNERRLIHFSYGAGVEQFERRIATQPPANLLPPSLIVNCQVPGPWAKYTRVWRCLFDPRDHHDSGSDDYFHF